MRKQTTRLGRPRAFDAAAALERALHVFWRKGYEGASLSDLTKAMRINRPSMYAAFGNKEALFRKALDRYSAGPICYIRAALEAPCARAVAEQLLKGTVAFLTDTRHPRGCLLVHGALTCGQQAESVRRELVLRRGVGLTAIRKRLQRARSEGDLASRGNPADLARYLAAVMNGMSVQAAGGATRAQLRGVAESALQAWPK